MSDVLWFLLAVICATVAWVVVVIAVGLLWLGPCYLGAVEGPPQWCDAVPAMIGLLWIVLFTLVYQATLRSTS